MTEDKIISMEEFKNANTSNMPPELKKIIDVLEAMKAFSGVRAELHKQIATDKKSQYDAYIAAGFSPEQALNLLKG